MEGKVRNKINFKRLRELVRDPILKPLEKCVMINLLLYAGLDGEVFPSEETLGKDMGRTGRQIRNVLPVLKKAGLIQDCKQRGFSKSNIYTLNAELYFRYVDHDGKYTSAHSGNTFPHQAGNQYPPKEVIKERQINILNENIQDKDERHFNRKVLSPEERHDRIKQMKKLLVNHGVKNADE